MSKNKDSRTANTPASAALAEELGMSNGQLAVKYGEWATKILARNATSLELQTIQESLFFIDQVARENRAEVASAATPEAKKRARVRVAALETYADIIRAAVANSEERALLLLA